MVPFLLRACWRKLWSLFLISVVSFLVIHLAPGAPSQIDPLIPPGIHLGHLGPEQILAAVVGFYFGSRS